MIPKVPAAKFVILSLNRVTGAGRSGPERAGAGRSESTQVDYTL